MQLDSWSDAAIKGGDVESLIWVPLMGIAGILDPGTLLVIG